MNKEFDMQKYVKEAENMGYSYFYSEETEPKAGHYIEVDPEKVFLYQFEWLRILKPNVDEYEDEPFNSIEEMIEHINDDGSCMKDYLIKNGHFPYYEQIL